VPPFWFTYTTRIGVRSSTLPKDGVLPQRGALDVALLDAEDQVVAVVVCVWVPGLAGFEPGFVGLRFGVVDVDGERLFGGFVGFRTAGHSCGASLEGGGLGGVSSVSRVVVLDVRWQRCRPRAEGWRLGQRRWELREPRRRRWWRSACLLMLVLMN
jgi:hypothetical protein